MQIKQTMKTKGIHIISLARVTSARAEQLQNWLEEIGFIRLKAKLEGFFTPELATKLHNDFQEIKAELHRRFLTQEFVVENVTTTEGRTAIADVIAGVGTYTGAVSHTALGTDNSAPAIGDTALGTETYRKALTSGTKSNNIAYLETFFTASEVTGTFEEYGNFIDGSGAADSGQILNRFIQTVTKSGTETLNVQSQITLNDA